MTTFPQSPELDEVSNSISVFKKKKAGFDIELPYSGTYNRF